jgi:hypothetical protein
MFFLNKKMETGSPDPPSVDRAGNSEHRTVMKVKHVRKAIMIQSSTIRGRKTRWFWPLIARGQLDQTE